MNDSPKAAASGGNPCHLLAISILELALMTAAVWLDVLIPPLAVVALGAALVWICNERLPSSPPVARRGG